MSRIIFDTASSLNGFIADSDNSLEWLFSVEGGEQPDDSLFPATARVLVQGSTTYRWLLDHEQLIEQPEKWKELYGDKVTFVFTSQELPVPRGADVRFLSGPVAVALPQIREAAAGADIWVVGGGDLAGQFFDAGALDEIAVSFAPVLLAGGAPLLPRFVPASMLRLVRADAVGQFARLVYLVQKG